MDTIARLDAECLCLRNLLNEILKKVLGHCSVAVGAIGLLDGQRSIGDLRCDLPENVVANHESQVFVLALYSDCGRNCIEFDTKHFVFAVGHIEIQNDLGCVSHIEIQSDGPR